MNWKTSSCEARGFCFWCLPGVISVYTLPSGLLLHSKVTAVYCLRVYSPMHEVVPSVVAMAVRMVMAMCRIFCQIDFVSMVSRLVLLLVLVDVFSPQIPQINTD